MEWVEITGRTVEEALDAALDELGVDEEDIEYEVLEEPRRGLLGLLGGGARIRARVKPVSREKPDRRRRAGPRAEGRGQGRGRPTAAPAPGSARPERAPAPVGADDDEATPPAGGGPGPPGPGRRTRRRRSGRRPAEGGGGRRGTGESATGIRRPTDGEENAVSGFEVPLEEQIELAGNFTRGLVERFGLPATVTARGEGDDDVMVEISGDDLGLLIGPRAATLDAVQELVRTAVQRRIGGHGARIHVDVAGYRARRQEALAEFARQAAQRALESGRDQVFEPMSPVDRKVVHDTVNEIEGVATVSEGEEPRRRVVIKAV
jgi:spoIIIJ-associated protein